MFGRNSYEFSTISEFIEKKGMLLSKKKSIMRAKIDQALSGEHEHFFYKHEVMAKKENARCKVCGMLLSAYKIEQKVKKLSPRLRSKNNPSVESE
jgi:predicted  nucleic acid-binding Zn-ribbon protein